MNRCFPPMARPCIFKSMWSGQFPKKIIGIAVIGLLSLFAYGADLYSRDRSSLAPSPAIGISRDIAQIWTRGKSGDAAQNAAYHFQKHGAEFGFHRQEDYVAAAIAFTTDPVPEGVLKNSQRDGDTAYYNPKTAEYAVKTRQGRIRTYFKLNPRIHGYRTNTDYFNAQAAPQRSPANDNGGDVPFLQKK